MYGAPSPRIRALASHDWLTLRYRAASFEVSRTTAVEVCFWGIVPLIMGALKVMAMVSLVGVATRSIAPTARLAGHHNPTRGTHPKEHIDKISPRAAYICRGAL